ncbi:MAG: hypothetical protein WC976_06675 [Caldisericia bacterium]
MSEDKTESAFITACKSLSKLSWIKLDTGNMSGIVDSRHWVEIRCDANKNITVEESNAIVDMPAIPILSINLSINVEDGGMSKFFFLSRITQILARSQYTDIAQAMPISENGKMVPVKKHLRMPNIEINVEPLSESVKTVQYYPWMPLSIAYASNFLTVLFFGGGFDNGVDIEYATNSQESIEILDEEIAGIESFFLAMSDAAKIIKDYEEKPVSVFPAIQKMFANQGIRLSIPIANQWHLKEDVI